MSGGSWDCVGFKVHDAADRLRNDKSALRRAFGEHLQLCADALHGIEWSDSGDSGRDDWKDAVRKALADTREIEILKRDAQEIITELQALLKSG